MKSTNEILRELTQQIAIACERLGDVRIALKASEDAVAELNGELENLHKRVKEIQTQ